MPKKATISSQNVSVSGMKSRLLDLNNDFWLRVILVPFLGLCVPYITNVIPPDSSYSFLQSHPSLYSGFAIILIFESNRFVIKQFRKWFKSKDKDYLYYLVRRIVFQLLFTLILLFILLFIWYHFILKSQDYSYYLLKNFNYAIFFTLIGILIYEMSFFLHNWSEQLMRVKNFELIHAKDQIKLLKNQIEPHYLFNSLSTLMSLIETDKEKALNFLNSFWDTYRYIIEHDKDALVKVKQEIQFIKDYIAIYQANYGHEAICLNLKISDQYKEYFVPTMSIQMLVENALKHNYYSTKYPISIEIWTEKSKAHCLCVKNTIKLKKNVPSTNKGLESINKRYKILRSQAITIQKSDAFFEVKLPLIKVSKIKIN